MIVVTVLPFCQVLGGMGYVIVVTILRFYYDYFILIVVTIWCIDYDTDY